MKLIIAILSLSVASSLANFTDVVDDLLLEAGDSMSGDLLFPPFNWYYASCDNRTENGSMAVNMKKYEIEFKASQAILLLRNLVKNNTVLEVDPGLLNGTLKLSFFIGGWCLRDVVMWAPEMVRAGTTLQLGCDYDLEGSALYSIKFYQGDQEFYRYVPKEAPPTRVFALPGIQVDVYQSNSTVVTLNNVQKEMTGSYKCEVSADAPFFHTAIRSSNLVVIEKPVTVPEILVEKLKYSLGEKIRANCTSRSSYPAANLTFYVNNVPLRSSDLTKLYWYVKSERGGLETSLLELETSAVPSMFVEGRFRLRCIATQYTLYRKAADVWLQEDMPQLAHVLGPSNPNPDLAESSSSQVHRHSELLNFFVLVTFLYGQR